MSHNRVASEWVDRLHLISFVAYLFGFHLAMWVGIVVMTNRFPVVCQNCVRKTGRE